MLVLALLSIRLSVEAVQFTLGPASPAAGGITLTGTGTVVNVSFASNTGDGTLLNGFGPTVLGTYTLGGVSLIAGPNIAEHYGVTGQTRLGEAFTY